MQTTWLSLNIEPTLSGTLLDSMSENHEEVDSSRPRATRLERTPGSSSGAPPGWVRPPGLPPGLEGRMDDRLLIREAGAEGCWACSAAER